MADRRPLWPARLHHLCLVSADAGALAGFYHRVLGYDAEELSDSRGRLAGKERQLFVSQGAEAGLGFAAFAVDDGARLEALRADIEAKGAEIGPSPSPLLKGDAFAVEDPDGNTLVFGPPREARAGADALPGRLQHFVVTSAAIKPMMAFYQDVLGFVLSDVVNDGDGNPAAVFYRSDPEHHSFAIFRADHPGFDHHA